MLGLIPFSRVLDQCGLAGVGVVTINNVNLSMGKYENDGD